MQKLGHICYSIRNLLDYYSTPALLEKCPNTEFFLVRFFPTVYLSLFGPNAGKCGPEKTPYLDTFHALPLFIVTITFGEITVQ